MHQRIDPRPAWDWEGALESGPADDQRQRWEDAILPQTEGADTPIVVYGSEEARRADEDAQAQNAAQRSRDDEIPSWARGPASQLG